MAIVKLPCRIENLRNLKDKRNNPYQRIYIEIPAAKDQFGREIHPKDEFEFYAYGKKRLDRKHERSFGWVFINIQGSKFIDSLRNQIQYATKTRFDQFIHDPKVKEMYYAEN